LKDGFVKVQPIAARVALNLLFQGSQIGRQGGVVRYSHIPIIPSQTMNDECGMMNQALPRSSFIVHHSSFSTSRSQKLLDRAQDGFPVGDAAGDNVRLLAEHLVDVIEELAAAVGAFDLSVAEQVQFRQ